MATVDFSNKSQRRRHREGFTLLEILVALAVLSLVLLASMKSGALALQNTMGVRDRTLAHWVAMNQKTRLLLNPAWIPLGTSQGTETMARQSWRWRQQVTPTPDPDIRKVTIEVGPAETKNIVESLVVYLGRPNG